MSGTNGAAVRNGSGYEYEEFAGQEHFEVDEIPRSYSQTEEEKILLGAILRDETCLADVIQVLSAEDFYDARHREIYRLMIELYQSRTPVSSVNIYIRFGELKNAGTAGKKVRLPESPVEPHYLAELLEIAGLSLQAEYYSRDIKNRSLMRRLRDVGNKIVLTCDNPTGSPAEMIDDAEKAVFAITQSDHRGRVYTVQESMREECDRLDARHESGARGLPTGLIDLDSKTSGLQESELIVVAARTSVGKTAMGLCVAKHVALDLSMPVFFVSLEQSRHELAMRLFCNVGNVNSFAYRDNKLSKEDYDRIAQVRADFQQCKLFIDDRPQGTIQMLASARRIKMKHGLSLVVVDYIQFVEPENRKEPRQEQVAGVVRRLKGMAKELQVPVIALAQLNRGSEDRAKPQLSDLRESGAIEQDADAVWLLYRPEPETAPRTIAVIVGKNRNGPTGELALFYRAEHMRFENHVPDPVRLP